MNLLIRCHQLSSIMTNAKTVCPSLMTPELDAIKRKKKRTDEEQEAWESALRKSLSEGAKTFLVDLAKQGVYGYQEEITSKYLTKGIVCEQQSIDLYNAVNFTSLQKNAERREDGLLTGECDLIVPGAFGVDVKTSWSLATFPVLVEDCDTNDYEYQARGYMRLWDVPEWRIAFCLVSTPDDLVGYEQPELHSVDHIPENMKVTEIVYKRDMAIEEKIVAKCKAAQSFYVDAVRRIMECHNT